MNPFARICSLILIVLAPCALTPVQAKVARIEIASRTDVLGGKAFGAAGAYEKIVGKVYFALDPALPANRPIVDLDKAPRDGAGQVTFSADLYALLPKESAKGNGIALFDVANRGRKNMLRHFNLAPLATDPTTEAEFGDGFLMRQGFTLIWVGWQFDVPKGRGLVGLDAPPILDQGRPVTGRVMTQFVPTTADPTYALDDFLTRYADTMGYSPVDPASPANSLIVRDSFLGAPHAIPRDQWQFGRAVRADVKPDISAVFLKDGFAPGHVYELSYEAQGAVVAGAGFAALRDLASAVKRQADGPLSARYAIAFGPSQDGRLLREFLYEGFNADEAGRRAFDGVIAHIAGAARGSDFNARFARPNGLGYFVASLFPYLDNDSRDDVTGKTDGLLSKLAPDQRPKIFYTNSSTEYWGGGRSAALIHTTLDGGKDAPVPDNVRIYLFAGTQHVSGPFAAPLVGGQQRANPNEYAWGHRALAVAMERWLREDIAPPPSRHPRLADHTLVPQKDIAFPAIPGVRSPLTIPGGYRADLEAGEAHPLLFLVPQVDADGNEIAGIAFPDVAVPLATYTGWNFRHPSIGQPGEILPLSGSYIPLPATRAAREASGDPRLSIEERYGSRERYRAIVADRVEKLVQEGYMLRDDVDVVVSRALTRFDELVKGTPLAEAR
jgi:alpha/beta hydrolase family protein